MLSDSANGLLQRHLVRDFVRDLLGFGSREHSSGCIQVVSWKKLKSGANLIKLGSICL